MTDGAHTVTLNQNNGWSAEKRAEAIETLSEKVKNRAVKNKTKVAPAGATLVYAMQRSYFRFQPECRRNHSMSLSLIFGCFLRISGRLL